MAYEWSKYPDQHPTRSGYYLTLYFNREQQGYFTKCIWWDGSAWIAWRPGVMESDDIKGFVEDTHDQYYGPCTLRSNQTVTRVDLDMFPAASGKKEPELPRQGYISTQYLQELKSYGDSLDKTKVNKFLEIYRKWTGKG